MDLAFTEDQESLRASVRAVLERECPMTLVRSVVEKGAAASSAGVSALWQQMVELGWPALTVPESSGGLGLGWVELAVVLEELGRACAPGPYASTVAQFLPFVRGGPPALAAEVAAGARGALVVSDYVLGATDADVFAVVRDGRVHVVRRDVPGVSVTPVDALDASRPVGRVTVPGEALAAADAVFDVPPTAHDEAAVGVAVETVGVCQAIFDLALEHAKTRIQFGVPIGSFQAIKHKFTDMFVALEKARATAYFAAACLAEGDDRVPVAASMAKAAAGDCQRLLAAEGIQILGGMGYTWEHDMHLLVKRAKTGEALFGSTHEHRARVADLVLSSPTPPLGT
jgi:alkylation response protein AidB-like acyl-CoA dehydrogenase